MNISNNWQAWQIRARAQSWLRRITNSPQLKIEERFTRFAGINHHHFLVGVRETDVLTPPAVSKDGPIGAPLVRYLGVLALFTLGNSSDAFLILRAQDAGVPLAAIPLVWMLHGLVKAPAGSKVVCVLSGGNVNLEQLRGLKWN